jgi:hypothetical protein
VIEPPTSSLNSRSNLNLAPSSPTNTPPPPNKTLGHILYSSIHWFTGPKSTFSIKISLLALALACPAWITNNSAAEFYYKNKGIWALITALTAKGMFSGETTFGFIQRAIGVVVGGVIGLVMWCVLAFLFFCLHYLLLS